MNRQPHSATGTRGDLATITLRRVREDARLGRFTASITPRRRRARGREPTVHIARVLLDLIPHADVSPLPAWPSVAGPLARHVTPDAFDKDSGTLSLACDSTAWLTHTKLLAPALIERLNAELGPDTVRRIRLVKTATLPLVVAQPAVGNSMPPATEPRPLLPDPAIHTALQRQLRQLPREPRPFTHTR
ncbi:DUF721 domain-containing protein [Streptomyces sp. NPDC023723]|uniref:DUF721 domain-containing protein n=1 Tax=Streptomyces sp. NPDC023723 TaxID=3154323 RepID=UPI0033C99EB7